MRANRPLLPLLSALVSGCYLQDILSSGGDDSGAPEITVIDSGWCYGENPQPAEREATYTVPKETFLSALDAEKQLSDAACAELCVGAHWYPEIVLEVYECRDEGPLPGGDEQIWCSYLEDAFCEGRAHAAVARQRVSAGPDAAAAWLARAAHAEASSVGAFLALAAELEGAGAPEALILRAREAARDEAGHARRMIELVRRAGGRMEPLRFERPQARSLEALATENAVEGCVGETWAALQAQWQAANAPTDALRSHFAAIAADEARHAELARDLHAWFMERLDAPARERVAAARDAAWRRLTDDLGAPPQLVAALGLPDPRTARRLAGGLRAALAA